jgi:hypothetical protein
MSIECPGRLQPVVRALSIVDAPLFSVLSLTQDNPRRPRIYFNDTINSFVERVVR